MSFQNKAYMKPHDNLNNFRSSHCFIAVCMAVAASFMFFMISFLVMDVIWTWNLEELQIYIACFVLKEQFLLHIL
jgi:hypothetical protein